MSEHANTDDTYHLKSPYSIPRAGFTKYLKICPRIDRKSVESSPVMILYDLSYNYHLIHDRHRRPISTIESTLS